MDGLPKVILIHHILDRLYGRDALNFMHSSPTFFKLMTPIQRLIHVRSERNLSINEAGVRDPEFILWLQDIVPAGDYGFIVKADI